MNVVRVHIERCSACQDDPGRARVIGEHPCGSYAAAEARVTFNRAETIVIGGLLRLRERWYEDVVYAVLRELCRRRGYHNKTCAGRFDHRPTVRA